MTTSLFNNPSFRYLSARYRYNVRTLFWPSELVTAGFVADEDTANEQLCDLEAAGLVQSEAVVWCAAGHVIAIVDLDAIDLVIKTERCAECEEADEVGDRQVTVSFELTEKAIGLLANPGLEAA